MKRLFLIAAAGLALCGQAMGQTLAWTTTSQSLKSLTGGYIQMHGSCIGTNGSHTYIYAIGGNDGAGLTAPYSSAGDSPFIYKAEILSTGTTTAWTTCTLQLPPCSTDSTEPCWAYICRSAASYNSRIYVIGRNNNGAPPQQNCTIVLPIQANGDINSSTYTEPALGLSTADTVTGVGFEAAVVINPATGKLYACGGGSSGARSTNVLVSQIDAITGQLGPLTLAGTLATGVGQATALIRNGQLYVVAGLTATGSLATVQYAQINGDGTVGAFTTASGALPEGLFDGGAAIFNGNMYVLGGANAGNSSVRNKSYRATFSGNNITGWTQDADLPYGERRVGALSDGNRSIYIVGGRNDATNLTADISTAVFVPPPTAASDWALYQ